VRVTVLVTGAGTGIANNLTRSLRASALAPAVVGCHDDPFRLRASNADRRWLVPPLRHRGFARALRRVVEAGSVDVVAPTSDAEVETLAALGRRLPCRALLPAAPVVALCGDKLRLARHLGARGVPVPATVPVRDRRTVEDAFARLGGGTLWCRMRRGAGSMGATPVRDPAQAWHWIDYWVRMRGAAASAFTLAEHLPGRDLACQGLWKDGRLVVIRTVERLSYFGGVSRPSGVSSLAALAKSVVAPAAAEVAARAVRALGPRLSGAFSVDLKERADGTPCVTEINAGRFITMLELFDAAGTAPMSETYVRLALSEDVPLRDAYDVVAGHYLIRDVDTPAAVFHATGLFDTLLDARNPNRGPAVRGPRGDRDGGAQEEGSEEHRPPGRDGAEVAEGGEAAREAAAEPGQDLRRQAVDQAEAAPDARVGRRRWRLAVELDRHALEALEVEVRALVARHGAEVTAFRPSPPSPRRRPRGRAASRARGTARRRPSPPPARGRPSRPGAAGRRGPGSTTP